MTKHPPIWVGGHTDVALRRSVSYATHGCRWARFPQRCFHSLRRARKSGDSASSALEARYPRGVTKTSVEIDKDIADQAAAILGTSTLRETIHASLLEIVNAKRRLELVALLGEPGRFDFEAGENAWGGQE